jgi:long-chain-acyl-CoA dehydrogenase
MRRDLFTEDHEAFRELARDFVEKEVVPHYPEWEKGGRMPRDVFKQMGALGILGMAIPEEYGGGGVADFRFNQIMGEEVQWSMIGGAGLGITLHNDICLPYFLSYCTEKQKARWLPGIASGELVTAIAMTEPGAGSDLAGIRTSAVRDGENYVVNGAKTFITNGIHADLVIVAARTGPDRHRGLSLLVLERGMPGFERGRNLAKVGQHAQDTAELSFAGVRVPAENLLGAEGDGFLSLVRNLPQERLSIAVGAVAACRAAFEETRRYVRERNAFGQSLGAQQNTRFVMAEMATEIDLAETYVDRCVDALNEDELPSEDAAKAKWWTTELQGRVVDRCVQLHGGYGYMLEYPIARAWVDARVTRIYGGATEVMKELIGKSLELS